MLTTEHPWTSAAAPTCASTYGLRLQSGSPEERLIAIPLGKHSIGSGPRCALRLQYEGIQPLECLVVHDETGLRVRRWSDNTFVNGEAFDDRRLAAGDVLTLGPVELEVVEPQTDELLAEESQEMADAWEPDADTNESTSLLVDEPAVEVWPANEENCSESESPAMTETDSLDLQPTTPNQDWDAYSASDVVLAPDEGVEADAISDSDGVETEPENSPPVAKHRKRRVLAALQRQRQEYGELVARVNELERKIEQAISESAFSGSFPPEAPSEPTREAQVNTAPDSRIQELECEVGSVREQLSGRDTELGQARYSIDVLERQLIDSQHTMHAFAEERLTWEHQFDELESRLAEYVERIQELERQLDQVRAARTEDVPASPETTTDWAVEATASETSHETVDAQVVASENDPSSGNSVDSGNTWEEVVAESAPVEAAASPAENELPTSDVAVVDEGHNVDEALDHLRGLSIWREEPAIPAEVTGQETSETPIEEAGPSKAPETASFIDRYAHLFPSDDTSELPTHTAPIPAPVTPIEPVVQVHDAGGDEESVEQYMAKLLERMRGPAAGESSTSESAIAAESTISPESEVPETAGEDTASPNQETITELTELKSKPSVAEQAKDRKAMRELANQSARHAIGVHTARKLRRSARTRCIVALLGAAVGFYLLLDAPGWKSLQFVAGCVATFAALYWGKLTFSTMIQGIRVGAFDHFDEEIDPEKALHPPLPIDVEPQPHVEHTVEPVAEPALEPAIAAAEHDSTESD